MISPIIYLKLFKIFDSCVTNRLLNCKQTALRLYLFTSPYLFRFVTCALLSDPDDNVCTLLKVPGSVCLLFH